MLTWMESFRLRSLRKLTDGLAPIPSRGGNCLSCAYAKADCGPRCFWLVNVRSLKQMRLRGRLIRNKLSGATSARTNFLLQAWFW